jgi:uncharacterized membrane protein (DUF485 family)
VKSKDTGIAIGATGTSVNPPLVVLNNRQRGGNGCGWQVGMLSVPARFRFSWVNRFFRGPILFSANQHCFPRTNSAGLPKELFMAGLDHGPVHAKEVEDPQIAARNARYGMVLFVVYLVFYGGFVVMNAFFPAQMEQTPAFGLNLAILYGFCLIFAAMLLAVIYSWLCRGRADRG